MQQALTKARYVLACAVVALAACLYMAPQAAYAADEDKDILLGAFTVNMQVDTNNIYASYDGENMYRISHVFDANHGEPYMPGTWHFAQTCPSIMYHDGYFWSLSGENKNDGKFWPVISYSKDLVHWTHPESGQLITGTNGGIPVDQLPSVQGGKAIDSAHFDTVAPEWSKAADGSIYIVFCAGYYGPLHGEGYADDRMQAYVVRVDELSANSAGAWPEGNYLFPDGLTFRAGTAQKLGFTNYEGANYIDGQLFTDNGVDYLIIKRDGLWNQLLKTNNIADPNAWEMVNPEVTYGYEGPSLAKFNGKYVLFTDGVDGTKPIGVRTVSSNSLTKQEPWGEPVSPMYLTEDNKQLEARHGTVITLKAGTPEWQVAKDLLDQQGRYSAGVMHRLYNPWSGEHFYTANGTEAGGLTPLGWHYEGIGWIAPETSDKPVYRLYNPWTGDHHYTTEKEEYDSLAALGWKKEGTGWYSADESGIPLYRQYNPYAETGTHNYTTSKQENDNLVKAGWKAEGIGWYGLAKG